jgi:prepilin-type N-terminal cleavage/methylation domain-containing protein
MRERVTPPAATARSRQAGFTLVEALTAIVILSFGLMAVTNLMVVAASSNSVANQSTAAADMAARAMESLKLRPWNDALLAAGGGLTSCVTNYCQIDDIPGVGRIETRWEIQAVDVRTRFIRVRSEGRGVLAGARSRAEFTTFRSCTMPQIGCP